MASLQRRSSSASSSRRSMAALQSRFSSSSSSSSCIVRCRFRSSSSSSSCWRGRFLSGIGLVRMLMLNELPSQRSFFYRRLTSMTSSRPTGWTGFWCPKKIGGYPPPIPPSFEDIPWPFATKQGWYKRTHTGGSLSRKQQHGRTTSLRGCIQSIKPRGLFQWMDCGQPGCAFGDCAWGNPSGVWAPWRVCLFETDEGQTLWNPWTVRFKYYESNGWKFLAIGQ